jgi:toxin secretion/phage lysis holin
MSKSPLLIEKERKNMFKIPTFTAIVGTPIAFLFGEWTPFLTALAIFTVLDLITGLMKGIITTGWRSRKMLVGSFQKAGIWIVLIISNQVDIVLFSNMPIAKTAATFFFLGMEGGSILENLGEMGVKVPKFLAQNMEVLKEKGENPDLKVQAVDEIKLRIDNEEVKIKTKGSGL